MVELLDCEPMLKDWAASASAIISPESAANYCATSFRKACTPRQPKAEWFGTGPGQWDAWMVKQGECDNWVHHIGHWPNLNPKVAHMFKCYPVGRDVPIPVGWQVLKL